MRVALLSRDPDMTTATPVCLPGLRHELLWIPGDRSARPPDRPPLCAYSDFAAHFPPGWKPDLFFHWSLEYLPPPVDIEEAECLTVAALGDWNLGAQALHALGGAFDLIFTDRTGCERLHTLGFRNAHYAPLWSYDPSLHRPLPGVERDIDIVMVGSFNPDVQRERAKWLGRVARLSRHWRVCVTTGVYGEEYARLMNRARIVFNRSLRGEINMRVYESLACGALLFYERENREIRDLLTVGKECVLYGDDDLEPLLARYLTHERERAEIAAAGQRVVQPCTDAAMYNRIFDTVESLQAENPSPAARSQARLAPSERARRRARHALLMPHRACLEPILREREQGVWGEPGEGDTSLLACLMGERARSLPDPLARKTGLREATKLLRDHLRVSRGDVMARLNLAQMYRELGEIPSAARELQAAISALRNGEPPEASLLGPLFPRAFDLFTVEWERLQAEYAAGSEEGRAAARTLLLWRALERLTDTALQMRDFPAVVALAQQALQVRPDLPSPRLPLARALRAVGRPLESEPHYRALLAEVPLWPEIWTELATLLRETQQWESGRTHLDDVQALLDGCPVHESYRPALRLLQSALDRSGSCGAP